MELSQDSGEPNYESYSLRQLQDVEQNIDRTAYPERYEKLQNEISRRIAEGEPAVHPDPPKLIPAVPQSHVRTAAFLNGGLSLLVLMGTGFSFLSNGLEGVLDSSGLSARMLSFVVTTYLGVGYASIRYNFGDTWPLYVLWPFSIMNVLNLDPTAVVSFYTMWVLFKTRPFEQSS